MPCNSNSNSNSNNSNSSSSNGYTAGDLNKSGNYQQTIQRDENGKSYLELGAKTLPAVSEWRPMWSNGYHPPAGSAGAGSTAAGGVKACVKCGHVMSRNPLPCYRHQRLSVLSLSMLKLNRFRQCSDPSLHKSVLICNTLRHIEDEMEREGLSCNLSTESSGSAVSASAASGASGNPAGVNCDTCCCSHCGAALKSSESSAAAPPSPPASGADASAQFNPMLPSTVSNADEDDSGFGDEDSRDIDWSSVFSMSTTSGCDATSASGGSDAYLSDSSASSDPSLFAGSDANCEFASELHPSWKSSGWTTDPSDFAGVRWKSELGDELEGFVHILVGS